MSILRKMLKTILLQIAGSRLLTKAFLSALDVCLLIRYVRWWGVHTAYESIIGPTGKEAELLELLRFVRLLVQIGGGAQLIAGLYETDSLACSFGLAFQAFLQGSFLAQEVAEVWEHHQIDDSGRQLVRAYLSDYPNYALKLVRAWDKPPKDFLVRKQRIFQLIGEDMECKRVLDVACGCNPWVNGYQAFAQFTGLDLSFMALKMGQLKNGLNIGRLVNADAERLPLKSGTFDVAVASEIMEHLPCPEDMLKEIYRVLTCEGVLVLSVPMRVVDVQQLSPTEKRNRWTTGDPTHRYDFFSFDQLHQLFKEVGFEIEQIRKRPYYIFKLKKGPVNTTVLPLVAERIIEP
jgi:ubiquinone/menaquinone biosynthesis C-methylase UbiE